ncbi:uncharacterized protein CDAR_188951 [Caerostris darwini]|uniref:RNase H type-1 domain-containing protein n=1 Tax=Caerostris darwini TaxID=1538125 RepID=A0AAV4QWY9_9ARAC|nr:uncharacterized protein CDAR_188951 [Caerostris darwini]
MEVHEAKGRRLLHVHRWLENEWKAIVSVFNNTEQHHETRRLSEEASVFMAELKTIETAIVYATSNHFSYAKIINDTRSVLQTKAYVGVAGNELADSYAKQAILKENIDFHLNSTFKSNKKAGHNANKIAWQQQWTSVKGRAVHMLCPKVNLNGLHGNYFINQIITGHGTIAIYQHKFFSSSPACNCGKEVEDRDHIIFKCDLWMEIRGKYFPNNFKDQYLFQLLTNKHVRIGIEQIMKKKLENILETMDS